MLFLKKEEVIGTFTIHLADYMVETKRTLLSKLQLLQEHLRQKNTESSSELIRRVTIISNRIKASLQSYETDATIKAGLMEISQKEKAEKLKRLGLLRRVIKNHTHEERTANNIAILQVLISQDKIETGQLKIKNSLIQTQDPKNSNQPQTYQSQMLEKPGQSLLVSNNNMRNRSQSINQSFLDQLDKIIVFPTYKKDARGNNNYFEEDLALAPNKQQYVQVGYDSNLHGEHSHYRLAIDRCLEETDFLSSQSFSTIAIHTGKKIITEKRTWLQQVLLRDIPYREIGKFRGSFEIIEEDLLSEIEHLGISQDLDLFKIPKSNSSWGSDPNDQIIISEKNVTVRVYIIDAEIEEEVDMTSDPDAYLQLKLGDQLIDVALDDCRTEIPESMTKLIRSFTNATSNP